MTARPIRWRDDRGQAVSTELLLLLIVALIGWAVSYTPLTLPTSDLV